MAAMLCQLVSRVLLSGCYAMLGGYCGVAMVVLGGYISYFKFSKFHLCSTYGLVRTAFRLKVNAPLCLTCDEITNLGALL